MQRARLRLRDGDLAGAGALVEAAARSWHERGDAAEEARCLGIAAALARHAGDAAGSVALAERARAVAPGFEQGYAAALLAAGRPDEAVEAFRRAAAAQADPETAALSIVDGTGQLQAAGHPDLAERLAASVGAGSAEVASRLALLASARALDRGDPDGARAHAERARAEALAARSPVAYVAAAVALARLADTAGDRVAAYASLAVGWATLRDLVGTDRARAAFQPHLVELRRAWGPPAFAEVKAAYEARVRRA
jgi:hypothetical protein